MARLRRDEPAALQELFRRHSAPLLSYACCLLHEQARAEELVQDVFLELYRNRGRLDVNAPLPCSLYRTVTRGCLDLLGAGVGRQRRSTPGNGNGTETALDRLTPTQKAAFLLSRMRGLTLDDVAECVDMSVDMVKSLIRGATGRLLADLRESPGVFRSAS